MYRLTTIIKATTAAVLICCTAPAVMAANEPKVQPLDDPKCGYIEYYPGAVSVLGFARGSKTDGDARDCRVTYQCAANANKIQSSTKGVASRNSLLAGGNYAVSSNSPEALLTSCSADERQGRVSRACVSEEQALSDPEAVLTEAECILVLGTPAKGRMRAKTTCTCE